MRAVFGRARPTCVVEERGDGEEFEFTRFEVVLGTQFLEEELGPSGDMKNVLGFFFVFFHEAQSFLNGGGFEIHLTMVRTGQGAR